MRANVTPSPVRKGKRRLLSSCAIAAGIMALSYGGPALAQAAGTGTFSMGTGGFDNSIPKTTTVTVNGVDSQSIINWVPTDNAATGGDIDFLSSDSTLNFNGSGNFVVLNRFVNGAGGSLSRQIALNGEINSSNSAASGAQGGSIWFYNAGGILIGNDAVINVGSLVLTASDIDTTGGSLFGPGGAIRFLPTTPGSAAAITVNGEINANQVLAAPGSSYVALVAPSITQAGVVNVNGSAAYVAAEAANISINAGLFNINVSTGTTVSQAITHTGTTTGPEQQATGQAQRIYMVAIPKNLAVSMLVSGQVGYQDGATTAATNSDGSIVLSAGYNIANGAISTTPVNATAANITVNDIIFRSDVTAHASGNFLGQPLLTVPPAGPPSSFTPLTPTGRLIVQGNATFIGDTSATLTINTGRLGGIDGDLTVLSGGTATTPGNAAININGGGLQVQGATSVLAPGFSGTATGDTQGGIASLTITGGGQLFGNRVEVSADADGGLDGTGKAAGDGRGGSASIVISGANAAGVASALSGTDIGVHANGSGAVPSAGTDIADTGGAGFGGNATIRIQNGGSLSTTDGVTVAANGQGGFGLVQSGNGTGGTALVEVTGTGGTLQTGPLAINARGIGAGGTINDPATGTRASLNGGDGIGGNATLRFATTSTPTIDLGATSINVAGLGGDGGEFFTPGGENATGGDAVGGNATVESLGGFSAQLSSLSVDATALSGASYSPSGTTARNGNARGGIIGLSATGDGSVLNFAGGSVILDAGGTAATGGQENAGNGLGGDIDVSATAGGTITGVSIFAADAFGGSRNISSLVSAGTGTGGTVDFLADTSGTISAQTYQLNARGEVVNTDGNNGAARGGTVTMIARGGGGINALSDGITSIDVGAVDGVSADGSTATGGNIQLIADGGTIRLVGTDFNARAMSGSNETGSASLATGGNILIRTTLDADSVMSFDSLGADASATTGANFDSFVQTQGDAIGGTITVEVLGGRLATTSSTGGVTLTADGTGGLGDDGTGGNISFTQSGGEVDVGDVSISATGRGGEAPNNGYGTNATDLAGTGVGGFATMVLTGGTFSADDVRVAADGIGAVGDYAEDYYTDHAGRGGNGEGGTATITIDGTADVTATQLIASAIGRGGSGGGLNIYGSGIDGIGGNGGNGRGGFATIELIAGTLTADAVVADAAGIGGDAGGAFPSGSGGGSVGASVSGNGGEGRGGVATLNLGETALDISESLAAQATGTGGTGNYSAMGGNGGAGYGGLAQAIVDNHEVGTLALLLDSSATGGSGGSSANGRGGDAGDATGGRSRVEANGPDAVISLSQAEFRSDAVGGNGGSAFTDGVSTPAVGGRGGNGGFGYGGTIEIAANEGATVTLGDGGIDFSSMGTGGNGGRGADNLNTIPTPGLDGILGTADDGEQGLNGGDGGIGGGGIGGTVNLLANGGTITSDGGAVSITVGGTSGTGGDGGFGSGLGGNCCSYFLNAGGRVVFEALATSSGSGQISLGDTTIQASGDVAGRIEFRTDGSITMNSLTAEAYGYADFTNNDTDTAPAGIFFAATGGSISTTGNMTLRTDGSFGAYAQGDGQIRSGGDLDIVAGDQVDLRHEYRDDPDSPTLFAAGDLAISAGSSISGAPGTVLGSDFTLTLQTTTVNGNIGVDRLDANNIDIVTAGLASVEHAEAAGNFTADVGRFRTGLNSIIADGDIEITSVGAVELGNSTAGGHIEVDGASIAFNALDAGAYVQLDTTGASDPGAITGSSIVAGAGTFLAGGSIDIGSIISDGSLFASGSTGAVAIDNAEIEGNISISAAGDITGAYSGGGDASLTTSGGNVNASVQAAGGFPDSSNPDLPSGGNVFVDAGAGNVTLNDSSAAGMFGVNGGSVSITNATAGEDMLVLAQGTATLSGITVGDDLDVQATGAITANGISATALGPDGYVLTYSSSLGFTFGQGEGQSALDGSDIDLRSTGASINAGGLSAGDDIILNAATTIALNGATTLGLGTTGGDSSIRTSGGDTTLAGLNAFSDVNIASTGTADVTGSIRAGNDVLINAAEVTLADIPSSGDPIDTIVAGRDIVISAEGDIGDGGTLRAGRSLLLDAGGAIVITSGETGDDGEMSLVGAAGVDAGRLYSRGLTTLSADNGDVRVDTLNSFGDVSVDANSLTLGTSGPITFANIVTDVGDATIDSNNRLIVTEASIAGTARFRNSGEHMIIRSLTANAAEFEANEMITMTDVGVATSFVADAGTTMVIDGVVTGLNMSLASADIDIASTGRVGTAGVTQSLMIENNDDEQQTFVGGTDEENGYHIDAAELTRIYGQAIEIFAPEVQAANQGSVGSVAPPDVIVDGFTMTGGQGSNLGVDGSLTIRTPGKMRVRGDVRLTGLSDDNALNLLANDALEVILGQGSISLLGANDAPGGVLGMASNDIIVATEAAIADVANATTTDAIDARLAQNDGVVLEQGALFAGGIRFRVVGGVYVQNSGEGTDYSLRRGLTFGAGGLDVTTEGRSRIVINGVHLGANGLVTGLDAISLLTIAGEPASVSANSFDPRSTFNGCVIASSGNCTVRIDREILFPVQDIIEDEVDSDGEQGEGTTLPTALITMRDIDPLTGEPLLDDPVTGAGNDDLWTPTTDTQQP